MDRHQGAMPGEPLHRPMNPAVVKPEGMTARMRRQRLGGKNLEGREALGNRVADLIEDPNPQRTAQRDVK